MASRGVDRAAATGAYKTFGRILLHVQVECTFYGPFKEDVGRKTVVWETDADTYGDLLDELEAAFPALEGRLVSGDGRGLAGETAVTKDGRNIRLFDGLDTPVEDGDEIRLTPAVYGG